MKKFRNNEQIIADILLGEFAEVEEIRLTGLAERLVPSWQQEGVLFDPEDDSSVYAREPFLAGRRSSVCPLTGCRCCKPQCSANCIDFEIFIDKI